MHAKGTVPVMRYIGGGDAVRAVQRPAVVTGFVRLARCGVIDRDSLGGGGSSTAGSSGAGVPSGAGCISLVVAVPPLVVIGTVGERIEPARAKGLHDSPHSPEYVGPQ